MTPLRKLFSHRQEKIVNRRRIRGLMQRNAIVAQERAQAQHQASLKEDEAKKLALALAIVWRRPVLEISEVIWNFSELGGYFINDCRPDRNMKIVLAGFKGPFDKESASAPWPSR